MMTKNGWWLILIALISVVSTAQSQVVYESDMLRIEQITKNSYRHVSYLQTQDWGKVECNGMIALLETEAVVFDTPVSAEASTELIDWLNGERGCSIKAVVPTHFHIDCLGGLEVFHAQEIPSYAHKMTIKLAEQNGSIVPMNSFDDKMSFFISGEDVIVKYHGAGHTEDNVVAYYPAEEVLFGGCLIKTINAGKGNLDDADVKAWPSTVESVKESYPFVQHVIPGHGRDGDASLLEYTIELFKEN